MFQFDAAHFSFDQLPEAHLSVFPDPGRPGRYIGLYRSSRYGNFVTSERSADAAAERAIIARKAVQS